MTTNEAAERLRDVRTAYDTGSGWAIPVDGMGNYDISPHTHRFGTVDVCRCGMALAEYVKEVQRASAAHTNPVKRIGTRRGW